MALMLVPGPLAREPAQGGPQLSVGTLQHVPLAGPGVERPAEFLPALLPAPQEPFLGCTQLCPQCLGLQDGVV